MKWHPSFLRVNFCAQFTSCFIPLSACIIIIACLSSCDNIFKGRHQFKSGSMYWLQFRGPGALGIAPENADPPIHFNSDTNLVWKTAILPGWSSPCIVNDRIFLTGFNKTDSMLYTFALNRENGEILWADSITPDTLYDIHPINSYANPTITSDGSRIFSHFPCYGLIAYNLDGLKLWEYRHPPTTYNFFGGCSPVVRDSIVLFNVSIWPNPRIQAQDCMTGDSLWVIQDSAHFNTLDVTNATPVFWNDLLIMHQESKIVAYNMKRREAEWWLSTPTTATSTPVVYDDVVYAGTWTNLGEKSVRGFTYSFDVLVGNYDQNKNLKLEQKEIPDSVVIFRRPESTGEPSTSMKVNEEKTFRMFDKNKDAALDRNEWSAMMVVLEPFFKDHGMLALKVTGKGELSDSALLWKITDDTPETPSPLIAGENIFFIANGGIMTVINRQTGEVVKKGRIGATGTYLSSPMLAGNRIYTCSYNGIITVLSSKDFSVLARNKLNEKIAASPVAVDDVLYVRTDKHMFAFRGK
jgi:outer membrane protein assembly factor BamB